MSTSRRGTRPSSSPPGARSGAADPPASVTSADAVRAARRALLEGVGAEVAASFPGTTRIGGQIVAALYLADGPLSMDALCTELGRAKSNVFGNLKNLEAAGIVEKQRVPGARHDAYALRGPYPDVIVGAYVTRLRRVVADKQALCARSLGLLGDAKGSEADFLRLRLDDLSRKYDRFAEVFSALLPAVDGPIDLEAFLDAVPAPVLRTVSAIARTALSIRARARAGAGAEAPKARSRVRPR